MTLKTIVSILETKSCTDYLHENALLNKKNQGDLSLNIKRLQIEKRVHSRFFHEKNETLKKIFFSKSPKLVNSYFPFPRWKQKVGALKRTFHPKLYT